MSQLFNFKSFFKFLEKNKAYTFIDVFGLSVSLMFVILIAIYTTQELSTDSFQKKADRIYLLANTNTETGNKGFYTAYRLADVIAERYPEIEKVCPMTSQFREVPVTINDVKFIADPLFADTTFFDIFSFPLVSGTASQVLAGKYNAVISESFARKAFAGVDPVGQRISMTDSLVVTVSGVMKDIKNSNIMTSDIVVRMDNVGYFNPNMDDSRDFSNAGSAVIYILAKEGADLHAKAGDMSAHFKEVFWLYMRGIFDRVDFVPLPEVYFSGIEQAGLVNSGDRTFVLVLLSVGILILLFAVINYINLTVAQTGFRAKEMATRRLLGSSRGELFARLILESTLLSFISFAVGLFLAFAFKDYAAYLLEKPLDVEGFISPVSIAVSLLLIAVLGVLSGLLPATVISNAKPIDVMKGSFRSKNKMVFSKVFITFQNGITIALIAASLTMILQVRHLTNAPLGYRTDNIIDINMDGIEDRQTMQTLANELKSLAAVRQISFCQATPFSKGSNQTVLYEGRNISTEHLSGDENYFDILGIEIVRDNGLEPGKGYYFNQYAFKEFQLPEDVPSILIHEQEYLVAGVVRDFQLSDITAKQQAVLMRERKFDSFSPWTILVEVQGDAATAYRELEAVYERVTHQEFNGQFIDRQVEERFAAQTRLSTIISLFCGVAILISFLGLLAMSTYFIRQRSREIAVRKVFGSENSEVLRRLVFSFLSYVVVAFVVATPVVWYVMRQWLADYDYRITLSPLIFIAAGLFCLLISFVTVFWQSYIAANSNPVNSLKAE
jgi:putative ABC transport system permease protein